MSYINFEKKNKQHQQHQKRLKKKKNENLRCLAWDRKWNFFKQYIDRERENVRDFTRMEYQI